MQTRRAPLVPALLLAATLGLAGCLDPYRAHVADDVLAASAVGWTREDHAETDSGLFGAKTFETDYTHDGQGPPFPALLQVFALRTVARPSTKDLLDFVRKAVDNATAGRGISIDPAQSTSGQRTLHDGLATSYFVREGTSTVGGLFARNTRVRIIGEVGYDGSSSTSVIAVGIAQVESEQTCPLGISCGTTKDQASWIEMVGDPSGSVTGATTQGGLIDHLVTHG